MARRDVNRLVLLLLVAAGLATSLLAATAVPAEAQDAVCVAAGCYRVVGTSTVSACEADYVPTGADCVRTNPFTTQTEQATFQCPAVSAAVVTENFSTIDNFTFIASCVYTAPLTDVGCPDEAKNVGGECREPVGRVKLSYTIDCVGDGLARVVLGTPELTDDGGISLITVNGSAVVGADIAGGAAVTVAITPNNVGHVVDISGPEVAPACATTTPTPVPTVVPTAAPTAVPATAVPSTSSPTAVPAVEEPTAVAPTATVAAEEPDSSEDTVEDSVDDSNQASPARGSIDSVVVGECLATGQITVQLLGSLDPVDVADQVQWLLDGTPLGDPVVPGVYSSVVDGDGMQHLIIMRSLARTGIAEAAESIFLPDCTTPTATPVPTTGPSLEPIDDVEGDDSDGLPLGPIAVIGGATILIAAGAYLGLTRRQS